MFWSWIYGLRTRKLSFSLLLSEGLVLVLRLLCRGCTRQVHANDVLGTKSVDLVYPRPSLFKRLPCSPTDLQSSHPDCCRSPLCLCPTVRRLHYNRSTLQTSRKTHAIFIVACQRIPQISSLLPFFPFTMLISSQRAILAITLVAINATHDNWKLPFLLFSQHMYEICNHRLSKMFIDKTVFMGTQNSIIS